ncbi:MAG: DUF456 domain-containing protein [Phycisphaerales bacterium]|nr:DUF456 domain-containing protein [Phycisphaerales bacterium]
MDTFAGILVALFGLFGVALTLLGFSGVWLTILVALLMDWWRPDPQYGLWTIIAAVGLGVLGEVVEFAAGAVGAGSAGGSKRAAAGAMAGGLLGAILGTPLIPIPIVGTIVGAVVGAGLGAALLERTKETRTWGDSLRVGQGAAIGRLIATVVKTTLAAIVAVQLAVAFWL